MWIPLNIESTDCETCGPSYEELSVEFDGDEWVGSLRIGCYGFDDTRGTRQDIIDWLTKECARFVEPDALAVAIEQLRSA